MINTWLPRCPAPVAQFLLRIPISILFLQQGMSKLPVNEATAEAFGLPYIVWWFVTYGEIGAAIGLIVGGVLGFKDPIGLGDVITRFSGITMACIMTGVIWVSAPADLMSVLMYDYLHVSLYFVGLYFALRGNANWDS
jgi:putative oxidoreductase